MERDEEGQNRLGQLTRQGLFFFLRPKLFSSIIIIHSLHAYIVSVLFNYNTDTIIQKMMNIIRQRKKGAASR
ncbi:hypothetical protein AWM70_00040 [Paenibacillus yonginensis]|uniref:Uncharacterized protein n=1 Tax=Paenibacillus yonginensis TaxID=1462996 RepID=A0A1B1MVE7_9BACL|nr:hypothetical protein AWM70_00040 [Paenibacillus yonginensis]